MQSIRAKVLPYIKTGLIKYKNYRIRRSRYFKYDEVFYKRQRYYSINDYWLLVDLQKMKIVVHLDILKSDGTL